MNAEILAVGTELLMGQIANTDAQFLSQQLCELGINVYHHQVVGDNPARLREAVDLALSRSDLLITTGGLGPTMDDLTKQTIADHLGLPLELHQPSLDRMQQFFTQMGREMTPNNAQQAYFPQGAIILPNDHGTAPGCIIRQGEKTIVILPGPPHELQPMFLQSVRPQLQQDRRITSRFLNIAGMGESEVEYRLRDLIQAQTNPTIAPYAKPGKVTLRVTASTLPGEDPDALLDPVIEGICQRVGEENIYTQQGEELEAVLVEMLRVRNMTIAVAESCTGGMLSSRIVDVPGASAVLLEGAVTYTNAAKTARLGVPEETLAAYGAVSEQTAQAMAEGMRRTSGADIALATTGIAGPDGGTPEKPVGLIYIALAHAGGCEVRRLQYRRSRAVNRDNTCTAALDLARRYLLTIATEGGEGK